MKKRRYVYGVISLALAIMLAMGGCGTSYQVRAEENPPQQPPDIPSGSEMPLPPDGNGGEMPPGGSAADISYTAVNKYTEDTEITGQTITSEGADENALLISGGTNVLLKDSTISRTSTNSTGGDNSSFYGVGAAVLTTDGTTAVSSTKITTDANGGTGIFSYGSGVSYVENTIITTQKDTSGALHAAGGGKLYAWNVTASTKGESSAAIRSDRGGGTMVVDGGSYTSNGIGSPAIYSTADIAVNNAVLTANNSEAVCIEGRNSIRLFDCNLTGSMKDDSRNECTWNVILYQSMSGDSEIGNSIFEMQGGELSAGNGGMFYTTNTQSTFLLKNVDISYANKNDFFLKCTGNSNQRGWGKSGANGADCKFTAISQNMQGNVIWDSISKLDMYVTEKSTLTAAVLDDESNAGVGGSGYCRLYISSDSTWTVTGDSVLTELYNAGKILDESGKSVTVKGNDGSVYVKGEGSRTVTVGAYSTSNDINGAGGLTLWSDYSVEKPAAFQSASVKPGKTTIKAVKALGGNKIKVMWKKNSSAEGYQIAYRVSKGSWKYVTVKSKDTLTKTLTKLKKGKKYQVKVRAYTSVDEKKVYGAFSTVKSVKCK